MLQAVDLSSIVSCIRLDWSPQIGDPTAAGWFTVAAYAFCAFLALLVSRKVHENTERVFWFFLALAMMFLCVNKQLDLQSLLTATGRCISKLQGWYDERRAFQRGFIEVLLIVVIIIFGLFFWLMRRHLIRNGLALLGFGIVTAFVAVRAIGFHHFDVIINDSFANIRYNVIFELSGLVLIALNAVALLKSGRR